MKDYPTWIIRISLAIITLAIGTVIYWQYQPSTVLTAIQPFRVSEVADRSLVILEANYCKKINTTGSVRISFVSSSTEFFTPMAAENMPTGCHSNLKLPVLIPSDLPAGSYYVKFNATYRINPIKTFNLIIRSSQFNVE